MSKSDVTKRCPICLEVKPAPEFGWRWAKNRKGKKVLYLVSWCHLCTARRKRERRAADPLARQKEREYENRPEVKAHMRARNIARDYGLPPEELAALKEAQGHKCAICRKPILKFHVDHCHITNRVRGLLCAACNVAIAQLGDNSTGVLRAVEYLKNFEQEHPTSQDL